MEVSVDKLKDAVKQSINQTVSSLSFQVLCSGSEDVKFKSKTIMAQILHLSKEMCRLCMKYPRSNLEFS